MRASAGWSCSICAAGQILLSQAQLVRRIPELKSGFRLTRQTINEYSPPTRGLPLLLHDGRKAWLDMDATLHTQPVKTAPWRPGYFCGPTGGAKPSCERKECIAFVSAPGSSGMRLGQAKLWGPDAPPVTAAPAGEPFLKPGAGQPARDQVRLLSWRARC